MIEHITYCIRVITNSLSSLIKALIGGAFVFIASLYIFSLLSGHIGDNVIYHALGYASTIVASLISSALIFLWDYKRKNREIPFTGSNYLPEEEPLKKSSYMLTDKSGESLFLEAKKNFRSCHYGKELNKAGTMSIKTINCCRNRNVSHLFEKITDSPASLPLMDENTEEGVAYLLPSFDHCGRCEHYQKKY